MGRDLSDDEYNRECEIEHYTKFSKKVDNDSRYGDYTILKNMQNGQLIMMKEKVVNTREVIDKEIFSNQDKMELSCPYLLKLIDYSTTKQSDFCSTFYKIRSFYEYEPNDLQRESKERQSHGRCFSMEELTHLLYNSIEAGSFLQSHNIPHGDIRPCYLHSCENGTFKLGHRMNDDIPIAQNQINNIVAGKPLYLAPSLFVALKRGNLKVNIFGKEDFQRNLNLLASDMAGANF
jgi:serine/threonine protein kinase